jgi:hypothetical protein
MACRQPAEAQRRLVSGHEIAYIMTAVQWHRLQPVIGRFRLGSPVLIERRASIAG